MLAVAELERTRFMLEERIRTCQRRIVAGRAEMSAALSGGRVDLSGARLQAGATLRDDQEARRTVLELAGVLKRLDAARAELVRAAARRRAIELLRDRDQERHRAVLNHREMLDMDDLMVMRTRTQT